MGIHFSGQEYTKMHIAGQEYTGLLVRGFAYVKKVVDNPGTLSVSVVRQGRNYNFTFSVTDPNGIRTLTSATVVARDGTSANALGDFSRSDANTFTGTDSRRNNRWASGSMTVVYIDAISGQSITLRGTWS